MRWCLVQNHTSASSFDQIQICGVVLIVDYKYVQQITMASSSSDNPPGKGTKRPYLDDYTLSHLLEFVKHYKNVDVTMEDLQAYFQAWPCAPWTDEEMDEQLCVARYQGLAFVSLGLGDKNEDGIPICESTLVHRDMVFLLDKFKLPDQSRVIMEIRAYTPHAIEEAMRKLSYNCSDKLLERILIHANLNPNPENNVLVRCYFEHYDCLLVHIPALEKQRMAFDFDRV